MLTAGRACYLPLDSRPDKRVSMATCDYGGRRISNPLDFEYESELARPAHSPPLSHSHTGHGRGGVYGAVCCMSCMSAVRCTCCTCCTRCIHCLAIQAREIMRAGCMGAHTAQKLYELLYGMFARDDVRASQTF